MLSAMSTKFTKIVSSLFAATLALSAGCEPEAGDKDKGKAAAKKDGEDKAKEPTPAKQPKEPKEPVEAKEPTDAKEPADAKAKDEAK